MCKGNRKFNSENFIFRETTMSEAFSRIGIVRPSLVREDKIHAVLRDRKDKGNELPSVSVHLIPRPAELEEKVAA